MQNPLALLPLGRSPPAGTLLDTRWRPSKAKWGASRQADFGGEAVPTHCQLEWVRLTTSQREVSRLLPGGILERDYRRAPGLNAKPAWLRSCCYGRAARQELWHWVGGACQAGGGTDHGRCMVVGAASVYGRKAPSALGGPRGRPGWAPVDVCGHTEESLDPRGLMAARGGGLSDLGAAHRGCALLPTAPPPPSWSKEPCLISVCTVFL